MTVVIDYAAWHNFFCSVANGNSSKMPTTLLWMPMLDLFAKSEMPRTTTDNGKKLSDARRLARSLAWPWTVIKVSTAADSLSWWRIEFYKALFQQTR